MSLFSFGADVLKNVGNFLLPGEPFITSKPISNVSTQPVIIGTSDTKTRTVYEVPTQLGIQSVFKTNVVTIPKTTLDTSTVLKAPADYYLTSQAKSTGTQGNIWDVLGKVAGDVINLGFNVLTQKTSSPSYKVSPEVVYVPSAPGSQEASNVYSYPSSPILQYLTPYIQGAVDKILPDSAAQPAQAGGITSATSSGGWIWPVIIGIVALFLLRRR